MFVWRMTIGFLSLGIPLEEEGKQSKLHQLKNNYIYIEPGAGAAHYHYAAPRSQFVYVYVYVTVSVWQLNYLKSPWKRRKTEQYSPWYLLVKLSSPCRAGGSPMRSWSRPDF